MLNPKDFDKIPIEQATNIPEKDGFYRIFKNRYWAVTDDNCILMYKRISPQCNKHKKLVEDLLNVTDLATNVKFLEIVIIKSDPRDWC